MFDWLFGSGRQTNYDDTNKLYGQFNDAQGAATKFYNDNIAGKDWNALDTATKTSLASQYGGLNSKASGLADQYTTTNDLFNQEEKSHYRDWETDRKSTRLNSSHSAKSRMPSSA